MRGLRRRIEILDTVKGGDVKRCCGKSLLQFFGLTRKPDPAICLSFSYALPSAIFIHHFPVPYAPFLGCQVW
jgi:hypothetical protein